MHSILKELCPHETFRNPREYEEFMIRMNSLLSEGLVSKIEPKVRSRWDLNAEFFIDPIADEIFMLHHPEAPYHGEWVKVTKDYLENPPRE